MLGDLNLSLLCPSLWMSVKVPQVLIWGYKSTLAVDKFADMEPANTNVNFLGEIISDLGINCKNKTSTCIFINTLPRFTYCQHFTTFALSFVPTLPLSCTNKHTFFFLSHMRVTCIHHDSLPLDMLVCIF